MVSNNDERQKCIDALKATREQKLIITARFNKKRNEKKIATAKKQQDLCFKHDDFHQQEQYNEGKKKTMKKVKTILGKIPDEANCYVTKVTLKVCKTTPIKNCDKLFNESFNNSIKKLEQHGHLMSADRQGKVVKANGDNLIKCNIQELAHQYGDDGQIDISIDDATFKNCCDNRMLPAFTFLICTTTNPVTAYDIERTVQDDCEKLKLSNSQSKKMWSCIGKGGNMGSMYSGDLHGVTITVYPRMIDFVRLGIFKFNSNGMTKEMKLALKEKFDFLKDNDYWIEKEIATKAKKRKSNVLTDKSCNKDVDGTK